jgi:His-Xaa-Ser system radical SAM maturase HxsC
MIPLSAYGKVSTGIQTTLIGRVTREVIPAEARADYVLIVDVVDQSDDLAGYAAVLIASRVSCDVQADLQVPCVQLVQTDHLASGDVVAINCRGHVRTLYRRSSRHNALFATDRCNSYCLMCSQPPRDGDDSERIREHLRLVSLISPETSELGITGGEPTLLKNHLLDIVRVCKERLPQTSLHILSNGRLFYYGSFARKLAEIQHPDVMIGIPLYSDLDVEHDYVVQARGAFDETLVGLQNLGKYGVPVEIRVVIHRLTFQRLPELAEFVYRNLTFAAHIALMGLELTGFTIPNLETLWIDPWDYRGSLEEAILFLAARGMPVSVYNHQLCTVRESIWPYCRQSISDWKNEFLPMCDECEMKSQCGGFFTSGVKRRYSEHIHPLRISALGDRFF